MSRKPWLFHVLLAGGMMMLLALSGGAADKNKKADKVNNSAQADDSPAMKAILNQLDGYFRAWDTDKDGTLDKWEVAWAFRKSYKAYDGTLKPKKSSAKAEDPDKDKTKDADKDKVKAAADDKPKDPDKDKPKDADKDKEKKDGDKASTDTKEQEYSKYPDYQFWSQANKDNDDKITKDEFDAWARGYASDLLKAQEDKQKLVTDQSQLSKLPANSQERRLLEAQIRGQQDELRRLEGHNGYMRHMRR